LPHVGHTNKKFASSNTTHTRAYRKVSTDFAVCAGEDTIKPGLEAHEVLIAPVWMEVKLSGTLSGMNSYQLVETALLAP
jgi:hypothetical protein